METARCDVRDEQQVDGLVEGALERHRRIDLLVNNAGGQFLTPAEDITAKGFRAVMGLNVEGTWLMTHAVAAGTVPLGRLGTEEEFAWLVAYLASPAGDYFSGAILTLDGARDNWFGSWPPGGMTDSAGQPLAEEREPRP